MDTQPTAEVTGSAEGSYARRAQALLADRAELFVIATSRSSRFAGIAGPPHDRRAARTRGASRQLSLPLSRERDLPRARMVG